VVVDDHLTFSELLARALEREPDIDCVGTARNAAEAKLVVAAHRPHVVVMDVHLGDDDGIDLTGDLTRLDPRLRVVVLTARTGPQLVPRAAAAGACALLPKDGSLTEVLDAIRTSPAGGLAVHPHLVRTMVPSVPEQRSVLLTEREREVLRCLSNGMTVRRIARELTISEHTARGHVKKLLVKLDAHSQLEAVAAATRQGLL
jgi:DNA-binding NarL/FixJ family response regulator